MGSGNFSLSGNSKKRSNSKKAPGPGELFSFEPKRLATEDTERNNSPGTISLELGRCFYRRKKMMKRIKNFKPVFNDLEDLVWFLKCSNFAKNSIMGYAVKFFIENKDIINLEMMISLEQDKGNDDAVHGMPKLELL